MPLARVTGMCSLSGCRAVLLRSSGWNWAASAKSWVSLRLPISNRPTVEPASTMPGQMSRPLSSMVWASGGIGGPGRSDRRDLAVGDDQRPPLDLRAGDRVEIGADQGEEPLGLRGDLDRAVPQRLGRRGHRRVIARAGRPSLPPGSCRWKYTSPSISDSSHREKASNGWALKSTMSASLPTSIEPSRSSSPSSRAGLIVIIARACASETPPYLTILAASRLRCRISSASSLLMQTLAPASVSRAALIRDRVVRLDLVGPPVGEGRGAGPVGGDLGGDLVALQHVLERLHPHAVFLGRAQQHQDLVAAIAVAVDLDRAVEDAGQGLEPQVDARAAGRACAASLVFSALLVRRPTSRDRPVPPRRHVSITASTPIRVLGNRPRRPRDVLAQGELHPLRPVADDQVAARLAVSQLDDGILAADRVGRPVEQPGRRRPAGQRPVDRDVVARDHVLDPDLGHDRQAPLVDAPLDGDVRVRVDDPGHRDQPGASMTVTPAGAVTSCADRLDLAVLDQDRALGDRPLGHGQDRGVLDQDVAAGVDRRLAVLVELGGDVDERRRRRLWRGLLGGLGLGRLGLGQRLASAARSWRTHPASSHSSWRDRRRRRPSGSRVRPSPWTGPSRSSWRCRGPCRRDSRASAWLCRLAWSAETLALRRPGGFPSSRVRGPTRPRPRPGCASPAAAPRPPGRSRSAAPFALRPAPRPRA